MLTLPDDALDPQSRRQLFRMMPQGIYVVTSRFEEQVAAVTIDRVTPVSGQPPLVLACIRRDSFLCDLIRRAGKFALHLLGEDQKGYAAHFFRFQSSSAGEINGQPYRLGRTGMPLLLEPPAAAELEVVEAVHRFDHSVIIGAVVAAHLQREARALLVRDTGWSYQA